MTLKFQLNIMEESYRHKYVKLAYVSNGESRVEYFIPEESPRRRVVKTASLYCFTASMNTPAISRRFWDLIGN